MHPTGNYDATSGVGRTLPPDSTEYSFLSLVPTLNFVEIWLQSSKTSYLHQKTMYCENMSELFKKIHVDILECNL